MGAWATINPVGSGEVSGSGTAGQVPVWTTSSSIGNPTIPFTGHSLGFTVGSTQVTSAAIFNIVSTTQGVLFPRMTGAQQGAISGPVAGLMLYNTDQNALSVYNGATYGYVPTAGAAGTALLNNVGIASGTTLIGGTGASENLVLKSTSNSTPGTIQAQGIFAIGDGTATVSNLYLNTTSSERQLVINDFALGSFNQFTLKLGSSGGLTTFITNGAAFSMTKDLRFDTSSATSNIYVNNGSNGITVNGRNDTSAAYGFKVYDGGNVGFGGGVGVTSGTAAVDLPASTSSRSSFRIRTGVAPTSPNAGDMWFDSSLRFRLSSNQTVDIAGYGLTIMFGMGNWNL